MRNVRTFLTGLTVALLAATLPTASALAAVSKCDAGVTKAAGKKASCKAGVHAKAYQKDVPVDLAKLTKCETKFEASCTKAKTANDCLVQTQPCAAIETEVDVCLAEVITNNCTAEGGSCWLLGAAGANCTDTCAVEGLVYDPATETYAGSGGTDLACGDVLDALGLPAGIVGAGVCLNAIACYYDADLGGRFRCTNAGTEALTYIDGQRACACMVAP